MGGLAGRMQHLSCVSPRCPPQSSHTSNLLSLPTPPLAPPSVHALPAALHAIKLGGDEALGHLIMPSNLVVAMKHRDIS
jgi:hypothetical protein